MLHEQTTGLYRMKPPGLKHLGAVAPLEHTSPDPIFQQNLDPTDRYKNKKQTYNRLTPTNKSLQTSIDTESRQLI